MNFLKKLFHIKTEPTDEAKKLDAEMAENERTRQELRRRLRAVEAALPVRRHGERR